jgi:CheY-like chemotaxis protein
MAVATILWVDDEIENLQSQKLFLENKGYEVHTRTNGFDAVDFVKDNHWILYCSMKHAWYYRFGNIAENKRS